jgi:methionine sulfoxide reductase catalytic subunit
MRIQKPKPWQGRGVEETPERVFRDRRTLLRAVAAGGLTALASPLRGAPPVAPGLTPAPVHPAPRNPAYTLDRPLTPESLASRHNIFDEMTSDRQDVWRVAQGLRTRPWTVHIGGQVAKPLTLDVDDLVKRFGLEERLYRFRCVETWAMAVPWTGFPFRKLVELAQPLPAARFVRMLSFSRPEQAPGWYASRRVFPYYEALTLAEATHELTLLATGIYGHPLPGQHGAPLRLVVPWKYGFKGLKSIVAFQFTAERPGTFWNDLSPDKYTFEANVEPHVPRPWPQEHEYLLGTDEKRKTLPYNGYADLVAPLYRAAL